MSKKSILSFIFLSLFLISSLGINAQEKNNQTANPPQTEEKESLLKRVERWYDENMNYTTITILMTVESSFIPFPSEVVIPPAAYVASKPESDMNIFWVVFFGTLGSILGALINYFLAMWLGRPIIYKFADSKLGHLCLLNSEKIKKAEDYFNDHGKISTFIGRLIPGIRQLISIPAGLAKMNVANFLIYTTLGAGIWNGVLALLGYLAHGQQDTIDKYNKEISVIVLALFGAAILFFVVRYFIRKKKKAKLAANEIQEDTVQASSNANLEE
jgi:membrane protein DedA with SNARE-associated domain